MIRKLAHSILVGLLIGNTVLAGLPPTSIKGQADASAKPKFAFQVPNSQFTDLGGIKALIETANSNLLANANFQAATVTSGWTTGGSGLAVTADNTNYLDLGPQSALLTFTASTTGTFSQTLSPSNSAQFTSVNMAGQMWVKTSLATLQVCSLSGGVVANCQSVPSSNTWQPVTPTFIGGSSSFGVQIQTTGVSTTGTANVAFGYTGRNIFLSQVSQAQLAGVSFFAPTTSCTWSKSGSSLGAFSTTSACPGPTIDQQYVGSWQTTDTDLPQQTINNAPPGVYTVQVNFYGSNSTAGDTTYAISDGTTTAVGRGNANNTSTPVGVTTVGVFNYTLAGNRTFSIFAAAGANSAQIINTAAPFQTSFTIWYSPNQQQQGFRADATPASWSGYQTVAGGCSVTSATFVDFSACTSITLQTPITARNITCTTTGSSLPGIDCVLPRSGIYNVCATPTWFNGSGANNTLRLVSGATIINPNMGIATPSAGQNFSTQFCGDFNAASSGTTTFKIQGATSAGTLGIENGVATGSGAITWNITEKDAPMPAPYLVGSNTTPAAPGTETTARGNFTCSSASAINSQDGTFTSIGNISGGGCAISFPTSTWSAANYDCGIALNSIGSTTIVGSSVSSKTTSGFNIFFSVVNTGSSTIAAATSETFDLVCKGPR